LQSEMGKKIQEEYSIDISKMNSVILIDNYITYKTKTSAVFSIIASMGNLWRLLVIFWIVPKPIRDWIYMRVEKNRYVQ